MKIAPLVLLAPLLCLNFSSCADYGGNVSSTVERDQNSVTRVDTYTNTATITSINRMDRKISLRFENGSRKTVKCGREVVNFPQMQVNDVVKVTLIDETVISLGTENKTGASAQEGVALTPVGSMPGGASVNTVQVTAKIMAMDIKTRMVTLKNADGSTQTIKVDPSVRMEKAKVGQLVTIRQTEAMALSVERP